MSFAGLREASLKGNGLSTSPGAVFVTSSLGCGPCGGLAVQGYGRRVVFRGWLNCSNSLRR
jgi:hypothetical protein